MTGAEPGGAREPNGDIGVYSSMGMTTGGPGMRAEINITPMIDILLVLIITFLVITPTQSVGLNAAVPQQSNEATAEAPPSTVVIYAKGGGQVEVNHQPVAVTDLHEKLMALFHGRPDAIVFVDGDKQIEFREVAQVIDVAKGAGIARIGLMPANSP